MKKIAIFIEEDHGQILNVGLELISETRRLVGEEATIVALYLTPARKSHNIEKIKAVGADEIIISEHDNFMTYDTTYFTKALSDIVTGEAFDVLLFGSTLLGRDLAPRLSARLCTGLTADATILEYKVSDDKVHLHATRPALGGNLFATILCPSALPQMATIRAGVFSIAPVSDKETEIKYFKPTFNELSKVRVISRKKFVKDTIDLTKANIIIAGGRGVATKFKDVKKLASLVHGEAAASRAVIDAGIDAKERLVGQTGTNVKPNVYVAFGISGAIQHVSGMDKSELIIAVNNDPSALIFQVADVGFICDAPAVMEHLIKKINKINETIHVN